MIKPQNSTEQEKKLKLTLQTGLQLTRASGLEAIVQAATDAGRELSGAQFGAFFYNVTNEDGESYLLYTISGVPREAFSKFPMPRNTEIFAPTFGGAGIVRSGDITKDPRYGKNAPRHGMPEGHLPVRSYLAVPVIGQTGEVLGGLFYGHAETDQFEESAEELVAAVAAQAAIAIENARLREQLTRKIADLERSHAQLAEFAAIVNWSTDAILSTDMKGMITSWNKAATNLLGFSKEEMIGNSLYSILPPDRVTDETEILERVRHGGDVPPFETVRMTKAGESVEVSLTAWPIREESGHIIGLSKSLRDISARKQLERSLLQSEKIAVTGRMAASIAHEINNPLEAVTNLLYLVRPAVQTTEALQFLDTAEAELARVAHIAKQTLGYYREHAPASVATLSALAGEALAVYGPRCASSNIQVRAELDATVKATVRKGEMMQVISNILSNAMPQGGELHIATKNVETPTEGALLCIADNGVGIPPEILPKIFDAFFTTRSAIGTGIGLYLAKGFIEAHGGTIQVKSSLSTDRGTQVEVFIPALTAYSSATVI